MEESSWLVLIIRGASVIAAGVGGILALQSEPKHIISAGACMLVVAAAELFLLGLSAARKDSEFGIALNKTQRFLDEVHHTFLGSYGDLRVTLLLPWQDDNGQDYLRPFLRNGNHRITATKLRIHETRQEVDGIAGKAWLEGTHQSAFSTHNPANSSSLDAYLRDMNMTHEFRVQSDGRSPRFVFAVVLKVNRVKAGVLCVDAMKSISILGDKTEKTGDEELGARQTERLLSAHCEQLEQTLLKMLYLTAGVSDAA